MKGLVTDLEGRTDRNTAFRHVLYTGRNMQLVLMSLKPNEDIGAETHATHDQFFRIETGSGVMMIDAVRHAVKAGDGIVVPAGALHNLINGAAEAMKLYTIYSPPNHRDHLHLHTKAEANALAEHFDGMTTE